MYSLIKKLNGLYHIASKPIDKFSLLRIINEIYEKDITINKDYSLIIDKSLDYSKFKEVTGYEPIEWEYALKELKSFKKNIMHKKDFSLFANKKILITGGTGSFGSTVCKHFLKHDKRNKGF